MKYSGRDLLEIAHEQYNDHAPLRDEFAAIDTIRFQRHKPALPDAVAKRAKAVYMDVMGEKERKATVLLTPPEGPRFTVDSYATAQSVRTMREEMQNWLVSGWNVLSRRGARPIYPMLVQDLLTRSMALNLVLPNPGAWSKMPTMDLTLAGALDEKERKALERKVMAKQDEYARSVFPIICEWTPATSAIVIEDDMGDLFEVWDYRTMPVRMALEKWKDEDGRPRAKALMKAVDENHMTLRDTCSVLYRGDAEHIQIAVMAEKRWGDLTQRGDARYYGDDELIATWEHGMGMNPYSLFPGRQRNSFDPVDRWDHFLKPLKNLAPIQDDIATQVYAAGRAAAYATTFLEASEKAGPIGMSEKAPRMRVVEGAVNRLPPGYRIAPFQQTNSADFQRLADVFDIIRREADLHTFTAAAYGVGDAESGYLQNQLESATKQVLQPFEQGMSIGMTSTAYRMKAAAKVLLDNGAESIPVRSIDPRSRNWVSLKARHVEHDWFISVEVRAQPVGGSQAMINLHKEKVAAGWMTNREAMSEQGNDHPERTMIDVMSEKLVYSQTNMQLLEQHFGQRMLAALVEKSPGAPQNPMIGQGLAAITQSPELRARLGPPTGGAPNPNAQNPAPPPPPPRSGDVNANRNGGGPSPGNAQGQPGGVPTLRDSRQGGPL